MLKRLSLGRFVGLVLGLSVLLGALGGVLWRLWWDAPNGMVLGHQWIPGVVTIKGSLYPLADPPQAIPAATSHWAILAISIGLIVGVVAAVGGRGREYLAYGVTLVGSVAAALIMWGIGSVGRGADPRRLATALPDGTLLHDRLQLAEPWLLALPLVAAGTVLAVAFLGWAAERRAPLAENVTGIS